jgi:hypothetical protein
MNTRWTPLLLEQVRDLARQGWSMMGVAEKLNLSPRSLSFYASRLGIHFDSRGGRKRRAALAMSEQAALQRPKMDLSALSSDDRLRMAARLDLEYEIAQARREALTAPLYRGGWPS